MIRGSWRGRGLTAAGLGFTVLVALCGLAMSDHGPQPVPSAAVTENPRQFGTPTGLPLPSTLPLAEYEELLFTFLKEREYVNLGWSSDKGIRDTGPYINGTYYGTHPAVRVYYSPGVMRWLIGGRKGPIPDGEMIIKEQYAPPAMRHEGKTEKQIRASLESWTVMVKDAAGSHDGWFWSNPGSTQCVVDHHQEPFDYPISGFGLYCIRCHAATQSPGTAPTDAANEFTFASLRNVKGFPGEPLRFRVDDSWRQQNKEEAIAAVSDSHPRCTRPETPTRAPRAVDKGFLSVFDSIKPGKFDDILRMPPITHDTAVNHRERHDGFATSDQCMSCHAGLVGPFGPTMFVSAEGSSGYGDPGRHVSPYGEWRWTPMGLAGRDPIFYAQLESEVAMLRTQFCDDPKHCGTVCDTLASTCLRCHGAMGKHAFDADHHGTSEKFGLQHVFAATGDKHARYGALARDGISCAVCHRAQPRPQPADDQRPYLEYFLETSITGNVHFGEPGEIYGPLKDNEIAPYAMEHGIGLKPKHSDYLKSSRMCGSCHTVNLPAIEKPLNGHAGSELCKSESVPLFKDFHHHLEQATYLEWLNSQYENEFNPNNPHAKSCQDCHMSEGVRDERHGIDLDQIRTRIAAIQDTTYPEAEHLASEEQLNVRLRESGYRRHNFSGLNVFLLEMFNQYDDVLGVRKVDYMTGSKEDIQHARDDFARRAREDVADLDVVAETGTSGHLTACVRVTNKVGHRFPSGVGFRRAFLELLVVRKGTEDVLWASGRANELGILLGADGKPLPSEFFDNDPSSGTQHYQPHHQVITSQDQVQIYETLLRDTRGRFTTSFIRGCKRVKDNRLLPRGWSMDGPGPALNGKYLDATYPGPEAFLDSEYVDGSGTDEVIYRIQLPTGVEPKEVEVRATLYYQAIPPYFLRNLFVTAPDGPATQRLHAICAGLDLKETPIEGWKLKVTSATCTPLR